MYVKKRPTVATPSLRCITASVVHQNSAVAWRCGPGPAGARLAAWENRPFLTEVSYDRNAPDRLTPMRH